MDSSDIDRIDRAKMELDIMLSHDVLNDAVLLVMANKQDLPNAMGVSDISKQLGLDKLKNRKWYILSVFMFLNMD